MDAAMSAVGARAAVAAKVFRDLKSFV